MGVQGSRFGRVVRGSFVSRWEYQSPPCLFKQVLEPYEMVTAILREASCERGGRAAILVQLR